MFAQQTNHAVGDFIWQCGDVLAVLLGEATFADVLAGQVEVGRLVKLGLGGSLGGCRIGYRVGGLLLSPYRSAISCRARC